MGKIIDADEITCPYCGLEFMESFRMHNLDDDLTDGFYLECEGCFKDFLIRMQVQITYSCFRKGASDE